MLGRAKAVVASVIALMLAGCASTGTAPPSQRQVGEQTGEKEALKVALFPWIPDAAEDGFESLRKRLEAEFERRNPGIDLELRLKQWDDSYYAPAKIAGWLASGKYDLVEIDTILLGDLVEAGVVEPWPAQDESRFFRAAKQGATITDDDGNSVWWGIPHLLCGFFLVSRSPNIDDSESLTELVAAVQDTELPLLGNFDSSWDLPSLYLDSRVDNDLDPSKLRKAVRPPLSSSAAGAVDQFAGLCEMDGKNPCVDGTFSDQWDAPVERFVAGEASGFWGYSERLHLTVKSLQETESSITDLLVTSIPLGQQATPLLFTDAFVRRAGCMGDAACEESSSAFVGFINDSWAIEEVLLSGDAAAVGRHAVPRYLLPATKAAFDIEGIRKDRLFRELRPFAESGYSLPNNGEMYERRRVIAWLLGQELSN